MVLLLLGFQLHYMHLQVMVDEQPCAGVYAQVKYEYGQMSYEKLKAAGADISFMPIRGMGHEVRTVQVSL